MGESTGRLSERYIQEFESQGWAARRRLIQTQAGESRGKKVVPLNCFDFFFPQLRVRVGCPDWARLGDGGDNFCYLRICDIIKDKAKPSLSSPAKGGKKSKDSPPL